LVGFSGQRKYWKGGETVEIVNSQISVSLLHCSASIPVPLEVYVKSLKDEICLLLKQMGGPSCPCSVCFKVKNEFGLVLQAISKKVKAGETLRNLPEQVFAAQT